MAQDFRKLLVESHREGDDERWFDDIVVGDMYLSIQASPAHDCTPREMLEPDQYEAFEVHLQSTKGMINQPVYGLWEAFKDLPWASRFKAHTGLVQDGMNIPTAVVQEIYEDLLDYFEE